MAFCLPDTHRHLALFNYLATLLSHLPAALFARCWCCPLARRIHRPLQHHLQVLNCVPQVPSRPLGQALGQVVVQIVVAL